LNTFFIFYFIDVFNLYLIIEIIKITNHIFFGFIKGKGNNFYDLTFLRI
jgi:hypothetical protein